jgi:hypothetical protein
MTALNTLQSVSVIVASVIASGTVIYGVNAWRREYTGKRKIELAEEVLALFYEARDAIRFIRSPFGYVGEGSTRKSAPNETSEEKSINDNAYVVNERYIKRQDLFNKIYSMRYRYMAQFGKDWAKPFDELDKIVRELLISAHMLANYWKESQYRQWKNQEEFQRHLDELHKYEAIFWEMTPDKDPITPRVEAMISEIEAQSAKVIGKSK